MEEASASFYASMYLANHKQLKTGALIPVVVKPSNNLAHIATTIEPKP